MHPSFDLSVCVHSTEPRVLQKAWSGASFSSGCPHARVSPQRQPLPSASVSLFQRAYALTYSFYLFWRTGLSLLRAGFLWLQGAGATLQLWCSGVSLQWLLWLWSVNCRGQASRVVAHPLSCPAACGIFSRQGSNPWPQHWQVNS